MFGLLVLFSTQVKAQSSVPYASGGNAYSQMWNISSLYQTAYQTYNLVLGTQKDTTSGSTPLIVYTASLASSCVSCPTVTVSGRSLRDSFIVAPVNGNGTMLFKAAAYASTATDTLTATLQESSDGIIWSTVTQVTGAKTLYPTSGTVPDVVEWVLPIKYDIYYRITFVGKATKASRVAAWYRKTDYVAAR